MGHLSRLLGDSAERRDQLQAFDEIDEACGPTDCFEQTARLAMELSTKLERDLVPALGTR